MKFLKKTLLLGLYLLLPIMLLWLGMKEIGDLLVAMATPIADLFPKTTFDNLSVPGLIAIVLIAAAALLLGLLARSDLLRSIGRHFENKVLYRVPMYRMLKIMSGALVDYDNSDVDAGLIMDGAGGGEPCYIIEKHKDGRATVLLPWSPASFAGSIKIVQQASIEILPCTLDEFSRSLSQIGVGVEDCMKQSPTDNK